MTFSRLHTFATLTAFAFASVAGAACRADRDTQDTARGDAGAEVARAPSDTLSDGSDTGMSRMNDTAGARSPDQQFLRMMSDHHTGLRLMAHDAEQKGTAVKAEAKKLDQEQDAELNRMLAMLKSQFRDDYTPKVMPDNQAMADSLKQKSGTAYDTTFRENVIKHHQQGLQTMAEFLPRLQNPELKQMVQKMKANQTKEVAQLKRELGRS